MPSESESTGFENGELVRVTMPAESRRDTIIDFWTARGFAPSQADVIADELDDLLDEIEADSNPGTDASNSQIVANVLRLLANQIKGTSIDKSPAGRAFRRVLEGSSCDRSLQIDAAEIGCTKQALSLHVVELRKRFCLTGQNE